MKEITAEIERNLKDVIPQIVQSITGEVDNGKTFIFYRNSEFSNQSIWAIITAHYAIGDQFAEKVLSVTHEKLNPTIPKERVVASIPSTNGWVTVFFNKSRNRFFLYGITDEELASRKIPAKY